MLKRNSLRSCAALLALLLFAPGALWAAEPAAPPAASPELKLGKLPVGKILFLGNSITFHPAVGGEWDVAWGMAASAEDKDYVHVLASKIAKAVGGQPQIKAKNIADFERQHPTYDVAAGLKHEWDFNADLVIVAIGENVPALTTDEAKANYAAAYARLLAEIKQHGNPTIIARSSFWADPTKDDIMRAACQAADVTYVDISKLGQDPVNAARSERKFEHDGIAGHPGDKGMQAIAEALWAAIEPLSQAK